MNIMTHMHTALCLMRLHLLRRTTDQDLLFTEHHVALQLSQVSQ